MPWSSRVLCKETFSGKTGLKASEMQKVEQNEKMTAEGEKSRSFVSLASFLTQQRTVG